MRGLRSMGHRIDDVVDAEAVREGRHRLRVFGEVGVLPSVADIHIEVDGNEQTSLVVVDGAPPGRRVLKTSREPAAEAPPQVAKPGDLNAPVEIIDDVQGLIGFVHLDNRPLGKNASHRLAKDHPLLGTVEVVHHQETAAEKVFPQPIRFFFA